MNRDKKFVIDSIKMDLFRVITATGDITKEIPRELVETFLKHADKDFAKIELSAHENELRNKLRSLMDEFSEITQPKARLRWTEDVMTLRCML
jgi:hypothetical protein